MPGNYSFFLDKSGPLCSSGYPGAGGCELKAILIYILNLRPDCLIGLSSETLFQKQPPPITNTQNQTKEPFSDRDNCINSKTTLCFICF